MRQQRSKSDCLPPKSSRMVSGPTWAAKWLARTTSWGQDSDSDDDDELWGTSFEQWPDDLDPKNNVKSIEVPGSTPSRAQWEPETDLYSTMSGVTLKGVRPHTVFQTNGRPDGRATSFSPRQDEGKFESGLVSTMSGVTLKGVRPHTTPQTGQPSKRRTPVPSPVRRQFVAHTWHPSSGDTRSNDYQADSPVQSPPVSFGNGAQRSGPSRPKLSDIWPENHNALSDSPESAPL